MKKRIKKTALLCTTLSLMLFSQVQAAQTYSDNWKEDAAGNWYFYNDDGTLVKDSWVHDFGEWYLLDSNGTMRTGVFRSNGGKYYVLDTVRGTGTYGKLLKDGMVYQGVVLHADTSAAYEGALSDETLQQLAAVGVDTVNVPNVENTMHVDKDADREKNVGAGDTQLTSNEGAEGGYYNSQGDWIPPEIAAMNLSKGSHPVKFNGYVYGYDSLLKEVTADKIVGPFNGIYHRFK